MSGAFFFDYPPVLLGLIVLIPIVLYDNLSSGRKSIRQKLTRPLKKRLFVSGLFFRLFLACLIIALAGPRWGIGQAAGEFRRGTDVVIALDVSRSMEIRDGYEETGVSRLERGLSIAREVVTTAPEIRYGAVIGKSGGVVAVPLSRDNGVVLDFLETAGTSSLTGRGTNLESLVDAAARAFVTSHPTVKVIVLVSDGEALSGSLKAAVGRCNQKGIIITAVAVGSDNGGEVPDAQGIISRRDTAAMRMAAGFTGITGKGAARSGTAGDGFSGDGFIDGNRRDAAETLAAQLRSFAPEREISGDRKEHKARWFLFTVLAMTALGVSRLCLLKFSLRKRPLLFAVITTILVCGCSGVSGKLLIIQGNFQSSQDRYSEAITAYLKALEYKEAAPYAEYGLGTVFYSMGEGKSALDRFSRSLRLLDTFPSETNRELRYRIHYNTGVVLFTEGDFSGAAGSFREALRIDGKKIGAKRNLELSLKSNSRENTSSGGNSPDQNESRNESMTVLLEYVKQKEINQWRSRTWQEEEEESGPDY